MNAMQRNPNETQQAYKARRAAWQAQLAQKMVPRLLFDSSNKNSYSRKEHGELKSA